MRALRSWAELGGIGTGPVFRPVSTGNKAVTRRLNAHTVNYLVQAAIARARWTQSPTRPTATGRVSHLRPPEGGSDRAIAHQSGHPGPLHGDPRAVGEGSRSLAGQCRYAIGLVNHENQRTRPQTSTGLYTIALHGSRRSISPSPLDAKTISE